jgi:YegS/Rv2252/BmrU family lipid kinase
MTSKRFVLVVNPQGGVRRGMAVLEQVRIWLAAAGAAADVHVSQHRGHAIELARTLELRDYDGFCLIGGDGTIHEVANGLLQRRDGIAIPLGLIPGGTGNSVLLHLGCTTPREAVQRILAGATQRIDAARLVCDGQTIYCLNIVGWGGVVDINRTAEHWRWLGRSRYTLATLWQILWPRWRRARLVLDGEAVEDQFLFVLGCNTKYTGKAMQVAPRAELADGKIDVVFVRRASRGQMLQLFRGIGDGSFVTLPSVEYRQVHAFRIETEQQESLNLDGELRVCSPVSVEMVPGALEVFA